MHLAISMVQLFRLMVVELHGRKHIKSNSVISYAKKNYDFIIVGSGIIGLTLSIELKKRFHKTRVLIIEKESSSAFFIQYHQPLHTPSLFQNILLIE